MIETKIPALDNRTQRLAHQFSSAAYLGFTWQAHLYLVEAAMVARSALAHAEAAELFI